MWPHIPYIGCKETEFSEHPIVERKDKNNVVYSELTREQRFE